MSNNSEQNDIDWKKKGLGWIPDFPDLKDYRLGTNDIYTEEGRLKKAKSTEEIEALADTLGKLTSQLVIAVKKLKGSSASSQALGEANSILNKFNQDIFGDITFLNVNTYIKLSEGIEPTTPFINKKDFLSEDDLSKRIFELKNCLYFLFQTVFFEAENGNYTKDPKSENMQRDEDEVINDYKAIELIRSVKVSDLKEKLTSNPDGALQWLRASDFKDTTIDLIYLFQFCAEISVDGIVGLETYTTLAKYLRSFSEKDKYKEDVEKFIVRYRYTLEESKKLGKRREEVKPVVPVGYPRAYKLDSVIKLVPVPPPIPNEVFDIILVKLKSWVQRQLNEDESLESKFEKVYLSKQGAGEDASIFEQLFKEFKDSKKDLADKLTKKFFESQDCEKSIAPFVKVFQDEYSAIEPIFSCILKLLYPLANFRNQKLKKVFENGLDEFAKIVNPDKFCGKSETLSIGFDLLDKETATNAVWAVDKLIASEIIPKIRDKRQTKDEILNRERTLCFYFFIRKLVQLFCPKERSSKDALSIFDKREAFEVCRPASDKSKPGEQLKQNKDEQNFFRVPKLQIPLSSHLINRYIDQELQAKLFLFLPGVVDLSIWCSDVEDQGALNSCTAFAGIALLEYFMNRSSGRYTDASPLFLYKATRDLMNLTGDVGASVREMMKAMAVFGVPPEQHWSYDEAKVDDEPPQFCYSYARNYQTLKYFRLDYAGISKEVLLFQIKAVIAAGFPCVFGLTIYTSAYETESVAQGIIPFPHYVTRSRGWRSCNRCDRL